MDPERFADFAAIQHRSFVVNRYRLLSNPRRATPNIAALSIYENDRASRRGHRREEVLVVLSLSEWVLLIAGLLSVAVVVGVTAGRYRLPLTAVLAVVGFLAGWAGNEFGIVSPLRGERFNEVVTVLFLPVLVFHAALHEFL